MATTQFNFLELKIPPPVVTVLIAAAMWEISRVAPTIHLPERIRLPVAITLAVLGGAISVAGEIQFLRARTTANPLKPYAASVLVTAGIYRFTRNPMYLGLVIMLVAWAVMRSSAWALLGLPGFMWYLGRFQIGPEERALAALFNAEFTAYQARVRRWL